MNIGFIGGGTMAEAILGGMLDGGVAAAGDVMIGEPVPARRDYLRRAVRRRRFGRQRAGG